MMNRKAAIILLGAVLVLAGCGQKQEEAVSASAVSAASASSAVEEAVSETSEAEEAVSESSAAEEEAVSESSEAEEAAAESSAAEEEAVTESSEAEEAVSESSAAEEEAVTESSEAEEAVSESSAAEEEAVTESSEAEEAVSESSAAEEEAVSESSEAEEAVSESSAAEEEAVSESSEAEEAVAESSAAEEEAVSESSETEEAVSESSAAEEEAVTESSEAEEAVSESSAAEEEAVTESSEAEEAVSESSAAGTTDSEMDRLMSLPLAEGDYELSDCIELGEYKGIELTRPSAAVTDEEVESIVRSMVQPEAVDDENATVMTGDTARISFEGKKDGVAFDGGTADSYDLLIGSGQFIDGFEDGVIGMKKGETKELELTFPEEYQSQDLAGQDVVFTVTVKEILRAPELNDEWAAKQEDGKYKTLDEYMAYQKEVLEGIKEEQIHQDLQGDAWLAVQKASTFYKLPAEFVTSGKETFKESVEEEAAYYGMDVESYLTATGLTMQDYETKQEQYGRYAAMSRILLDALVEAEGLSEDSEEYEEQLQQLADDFGVTKEQVFEGRTKEDVNQYLLTQVAVERIISYANVTEE